MLFGRTGLVEDQLLPTDIGGCVLWARSDSAWQDAAKTVPCTADSLIWTGEDKSLDNDATQATESKRPVYKTGQLDGNPASRFDGGDDVMQVYNTIITELLNGANKPVTIFVVIDPISWTDGSNMVLTWNAPGSASGLWIRFYSNGNYEFCGGGGTGGWKDIAWAQSNPLSPHYLIVTKSTAGLGNAWVDSIQKVTDGNLDLGTLSGMDRFFIGDYDGTSFPMNADYYEIAIYDNEISAANRALLNAYAVARYPSI